MFKNECRGKPCVCPQTKTKNEPMSEGEHMDFTIELK
jgi:hypothetical protein